MSGIDLQSALGLMAMLRLSGVGWVVALRVAQLCKELDPPEATHRSDWQRAIEEAREEAERCRADGISIISIFDSSYPERLRRSKTPPPVVYVQGEVGMLNRARTVVLAGSTKPSLPGTAATENIASALAESGWTLAGSLTGGVETTARHAAHAVGAPTVAVVGRGLATLTSPKQELVKEILAQGGAVVSAEPLEATERANREAAARRIASGLATGVVVTDALLTDFARHTIQAAALQERPVVCVRPPASEAGEGEPGLEALLDAPAKALVDTRGWRSRDFAAILGDEPLAEAAPADPRDLVSKLERALDTELRDPMPPKWWLGIWQKEEPLVDGRAATPQLRADAALAT